MEQRYFSRRTEHNGFVCYERADYLLAGRVVGIIGSDVLKIWTASGICNLRLLDLSAAELRQRQFLIGRFALWLPMFLRKVVVQVVGEDSQGRPLARLWRDLAGQEDSACKLSWLQSRPRCPDCSSDMLLRQVRSGPTVGALIWGCSGFPLCQAIRHID